MTNTTTSRRSLLRDAMRAALEGRSELGRGGERLLSREVWGVGRPAAGEARVIALRPRANDSVTVASDGREQRCLTRRPRMRGKGYRSMEEFQREEIRTQNKVGWSLDDLYYEANLDRRDVDPDADPNELNFE